MPVTRQYNELLPHLWKQQAFKHRNPWDVMASWPDKDTFDRLNSEFDTEILGEGWGYLYPRLR
jgi:hypothetical protein